MAKDIIESTILDVVIDSSINNPTQVCQNCKPCPCPCSNLSYKNSIICRICHNGDSFERLITPCNCKGTLGYVHRHCLENWLSRSGLTHCELCKYIFKTTQELRYTICQSLKIWYSHPNNCGLLQADLLACSIISFLTVRNVFM